MITLTPPNRGRGTGLDVRAAFTFKAGQRRMGRLKALGARLLLPKPRLTQAPKVVEQFYSSREWQQLKAQRRRDLDYRAALLRAKPGERLILDHIVERRDGGADLDPSNTEWLTMSEHNAKTAKARASRSRGGTWGGGSKV